MAWDIELAKMMKDRENIPHSGIQTGQVVTPLPNIKISLSSGIQLTSNHLIIGESIERYNNIDGTCLNSGDKVIIMPAADEQKYFLIDRVM